MPQLSELVREVAIACGDQRVALDLKGLINRAQQTIAQRHNWTSMHDNRSYTLTAGSAAISANTAAAASVVTTSAAHGRSSGDTTVISGSNSVPPIDGEHVITVLSSTTFSVPVTVTTPGTTGAAAFRSVALGSDFKMLTQEQSPVSIIYAGYNLPVKVCSREEVERRGIWPWMEYTMPVPTPGQPYPILMVYLQKRGTNQWTLNIPLQFGTPSTSMVFNVSAYYYPSTLTLGTDTTAITEHPELGEALVNLARSYVWSALDPTDPRVEAAQKIYEDRFQTALYADKAQEVNGRVLRM